MTNTHRKTTTRTTARIAAVGAFGIGAAIAVPGLAAAQEPAPEPSATSSLEGLTAQDGSLAELTGDEGSLQGALGTDLNLDLGSLALNLNLDAETPTPGSVEFGSLGVSPNTGSQILDGGSAEGDAGDDSGSLSTGSLGQGSSDDAADDTGSLNGALAGLSSGAIDTDAGVDAGAGAGVGEDAAVNSGSLG